MELALQSRGPWGTGWLHVLLGSKGRDRALGLLTGGPLQVPGRSSALSSARYLCSTNALSTEPYTCFHWHFREPASPSSPSAVGTAPSNPAPTSTAPSTTRPRASLPGRRRVSAGRLPSEEPAFLGQRLPSGLLQPGPLSCDLDLGSEPAASPPGKPLSFPHFWEALHRPFFS